MGWLYSSATMSDTKTIEWGGKVRLAADLHTKIKIIAALRGETNEGTVDRILRPLVEKEYGRAVR